MTPPDATLAGSYAESDPSGRHRSLPAETLPHARDPGVQLGTKRRESLHIDRAAGLRRKDGRRNLTSGRGRPEVPCDEPESPGIQNSKEELMRKYGNVTKSLALMLAIAVAALVGVPLAPTTQAAAVGATDVDITLPDIVILHYFSDVDVEISNGALGTFLTGSLGDSTIVETTPVLAAGGFTQDLSISPTSALTGSPSAAVLTLQNAWAVRAISLAGGVNTELAIANTDDTLDHTLTTATITVTGVAVDDGANNGATIQFASPGLVSPAVGDVELTLDLTNATNAGVYENAIFTLTATNV